MKMNLKLTQLFLNRKRRAEIKHFQQIKHQFVRPLQGQIVLVFFFITINISSLRDFIILHLTIQKG